MNETMRNAIRHEENRMRREAKEEKEEREMQEIYNSCFEPDRDERGFIVRK